MVRVSCHSLTVLLLSRAKVAMHASSPISSCLSYLIVSIVLYVAIVSASEPFCKRHHQWNTNKQFCNIWHHNTSYLCITNKEIWYRNILFSTVLQVSLKIMYTTATFGILVGQLVLVEGWVMDDCAIQHHWLHYHRPVSHHLHCFLYHKMVVHMLVRMRVMV